jgi:hypothetical protein
LRSAIWTLLGASSSSSGAMALARTTRLQASSLDIGGKKTSCTTITIPALVKEQEAELTLTECPADPWRTRSITVRSTKEDRKVRWAAER